MTAVSYFELFEVEKGKEVVAKLPEDERERLLMVIPVPFARAGRIDDAVRESEAVNSPGAWAMVAGICSRKDVPRALKLLEKVPEKSRDWPIGDMKGAASTVAMIKNEENREMAKTWLVAGRMAQGIGSPNKDLPEEKVDHESMEYVYMNLAEMAENNIEAGELKKAEQILGLLKTLPEQARVHVALAKYYLKHKQMKEYQAAIDQAIKETSAIGDPDHNGWGNIQSAGEFLDIANIQVKAGQFDAAMKSIGLADVTGKDESKKWQEQGVKSGGIFNALGGKQALIGLLILADKTDEAVKVATKKDGTMMPEAMPLLAETYAAKGRSKELSALLGTVKRPEVVYKLFIYAAWGAAKKAGLIPTDDERK
jgi:tetratricopeptide (TPR) repeat protein